MYGSRTLSLQLGQGQRLMAGRDPQLRREEVREHVRLLASVFLLEVVRGDEPKQLGLERFVVVQGDPHLGRLVQEVEKD